MKLEWKRERGLCIEADDATEQWTDPTGVTFEIPAKYGNPLDIVSLKSNIIEDFKARIDEIRESRSALYQGDRLFPVLCCPACNASSDGSYPELTVYDAQYRQCGDCGHVFVSPRPTEEAVDDYYAKSSDYSSTYTDIPTAMLRVEQIGAPRVSWVLETFRRRFGREPASVLDVGAGGGHFVRACREAGLKADGVEISGPSRRFAFDHFGIELIDANFTGKFNLGEPDVITFWGVIEHVTAPASLVEAAANRLGSDGLVVANVPRWNCLDTATQTVFTDSVVRHLDPLGHIHCFTDNSLVHLFSRFSLDPAAVWYFGMDAYELLMQCALRSNDSEFFDRTKIAIPALQNAIDRCGLSDEITLAFVPRSSGV